ncbi:MAG: dephospho-CoA kinase [Paraperlucidibaca sp.]
MAAWILGVSGGIGSGKTAATDYFHTLGIDVVDADVVAREIVQPGEPALAAIAAHFGEQILLADGALNRAALREIVFAEPDQRQALEAITHPAIRQRLQDQCTAAQSAYAILASPLLWESGQAALTQRTLLIDVSEATQLARASHRDGVSEAQIRAIMAAQWSRQQRLAAADDTISNEGSLAELHQRIDALHTTYLAWQP